VEDDFFGSLGFVEDDARAAHFGAGAGGSGDCDDRGDAGGGGSGPPVLLVLEIPQGAALAGHESDYFAHVERRAPTERDHSVMRPSGVGRDSCLHVCADRVRLYPREDLRLHGRGSFLDHRQLGEAWIGNQQRPLHPERAARLAKLGDTAGAEADRGGIVPVGVGQGHQGLLRWKDLGRVTLS
jgi:hypothetical protein